MIRTIRLLVCFLAVPVYSDIYLHNPRGSNNRLDEATRQRKNARRLFDSENNNRGGYNVGSLYYYPGSKLQIEWTNQHSCGGPNNHCENILQYMCGDLVRDGADTDTIPVKPYECANSNCSTDTEYGMHEDHDYYLHCAARERNKGLFIADQKLRSHAAIYTRQTPNGERYGFECAEERDYYPYWEHSPWIDIAVLTNDASRCPYYQSESQNVKSRWKCVVPREALLAADKNKDIIIPTQERQCQAFKWPIEGSTGVYGEWVEMPAHGVDPPECRETEYSRDNHLGNGIGGYTPTYNWTIPDTVHEQCVLRIRYNISTGDYEGWNDTDHRHNKQKGNDATIDMAAKFGFENENAARQRGYLFKNYPQVQIFPELSTFKLQLAINTAQYGRTFQDRSHTFEIRERPEDLKDEVIHNLNVRGKRGNIVQVYPAVEYDFVPNTLEVAEKEHVHFQWTGSNTNPDNNDGEGATGTDRSNVLVQEEAVYEEGEGLPYKILGKFGHWGRSYPAHIYNSSFLGFSEDDRLKLALLDPYHFRGSMDQLNDASTYFDLGPRKVTSVGIYHYLSTRNNNFSNRSQKGRLIVRDFLVEQKSIGWNGGVFELSNKEAKVVVPRAAFKELKKLRLEQWSPEFGKEVIKSVGGRTPSGDYSSDYFVIHPEEDLSENGALITVYLKVAVGKLDKPSLYRADSDSFDNWSKIEADISREEAVFQTSKGGTYVVMSDSSVGVVIGIVIGCLVLITVLVVGTVCYCRKKPSSFNAIKRSIQSKV